MSPEVAPNVPLGHREQVRAPANEYLPWGHATQAVLVEAPRAVLAVPAGQGVGVKELKGQKDPLEQSTGAPVEHAKPAGHGTQVSWRKRLLE